MSPFAIAVIAFSMSMDSFAVSVGLGAARGRPRTLEALRTGAVFGLVEASTPFLGWLAGLAACRFVAAVDHWIAFALLAGVGLHMSLSALRGGERSVPSRRSLLFLIGAAICTSLDAMAVGVSMALLRVNIVVIAVAIGFATFTMSSGGVLIGRQIGGRFGRAAEFAAGLALCVLGAAILRQHLIDG